MAHNEEGESAAPAVLAALVIGSILLGFAFGGSDWGWGMLCVWAVFVVPVWFLIASIGM